MAQSLTPSKSDPAPSAELIPARWLWPARLAFLAVVVLTVFLFVFGIPDYYRQLSTVCAAAPCGNSPTAEAAQALLAAGISVEAAARWMVAMVLVAAIVPGVVALVIFWRRSDNRMAWFTALTLLTFGTFGIHGSGVFISLLSPYPLVWWVLVYVLFFLGTATITAFFFIFPDGRFQPRWLRWAVTLTLTLQALTIILPGTLTDTETWPLPFQLLFWFVYFGMCGYALVYRYRRVSNFHQRQQTKWVVLGVALALAGSMIGFSLLSLAPQINPAWAVYGYFADSSYYIFVQFMPLSIGFAMFRSGLWDVDVLINRALVYGLLTALLAAIYGGLVIGLQTLFTRFTGQTSDLALIGSTLAIVALFQPLRRGVDTFIARRFYRRRYDSQQVLTAFAGVLRDHPYTNPDDLSGMLVQVVEETIQPAHVTLRLTEVPGQPAMPKPGAGV